MGVVRATHFSPTKWATRAGSWVTFCGLGRFRVDISRGVPAVLHPHHPPTRGHHSPEECQSPLATSPTRPGQLASKSDPPTRQAVPPRACMYSAMFPPPQAGLPRTIVRAHQHGQLVNPSSIPCGLGCPGLPNIQYIANQPPVYNNSTLAVTLLFETLHGRCTDWPVNSSLRQGLEAPSGFPPPNARACRIL
jgi:hypothetical protein